MTTSQQSVASAIRKGNQIVAEILAAIRAGDYDRAAQLGDSVLALGVEHPAVYNARALAFQQKNQFREALAEFSRASALVPGDSNIITAMGVCLINLSQPLDAIRTFENAIAINPENAQAHYRKGWTIEMLGDRDEARRCFVRAVELDPKHADALAGVASTLAGTAKLYDALPYAERALAVNPAQPTAMMVLGMADLERKDYVAAETRFRTAAQDPLLTSRARAVIEGHLADALDGQGRADEAFAAWRFEKNEFRKLYAQNYANEVRPREIAERIAGFLEANPWTPAPEEKEQTGALPRTHAFLVGFPRSGTTLLEQILASHPDVRALEEQDFLAQAAQTFLSSDDGLHRLSTLGPLQLASLRDAYWKSVRERHDDIAGKVFVDKLPMNTVKLPLIAKMFPDARIIFALRDPRDVILSCYRRHFVINTTMFEFLTLDDAVDLYGAVMRLGNAAHAKLPLAFYDHRYEDMVADLNGSLARLCEFIDLPWNEAMADFHRAETGLDVRSPSALQIRRPLNPDSVGAWRRYRTQLTPVLPLLRPWAEQFGYPGE